MSNKELKPIDDFESEQLKNIEGERNCMFQWASSLRVSVSDLNEYSNWLIDSYLKENKKAMVEYKAIQKLRKEVDQITNLETIVEGKHAQICALRNKLLRTTEILKDISKQSCCGSNYDKCGNADGIAEQAKECLEKIK